MALLGRAALVAALFAVTGAAGAQELDFNLERLRLDPSARGSLVMGDGEVLPSETARLFAAIHYERRPLVLVDDGDLRGRGVAPDRTRAADLVADRTTLHLGAALGFAGGLEAGVEVPVILEQDGDDPALGDDGIAAPWVHLRWGSTSPKPITFGASFDASPGWGDGTRFNGDPDWSFVPGLEVGVHLGGSLVMANVAALLRSEDVVLTNGETLSHEAVAALGWATTGRPVRVEVTARGAFDLDGLGQSAQLLGGVRIALGPGELYVLGGPGFRELPGTPTFRWLAGIALPSGDRAPPKPAAAPPPPPPPAKVDPCAPGQKHAPEQCPDADDDGDGVPNGADKCPLVKGIAAAEGCPPKDTDGDGVADHEDRCPAEKGVPENQGCPPADADGDGIPDAQDRCPNQPGVPAEQGCPPARAQINVETKKIEIKEKVFFDTGKSTIQQRSFQLLDDVAALLVANPGAGRVTIEGHTDDTGPAELNRKLSQDRAESVKAYLVSKGVDAARLDATGFGPDRPAQPNTTAKGREANRRVEFVLQG